MNDKFPGRPDYVGPTKGYFGLLHHDRLFEISDDVMEHVEFVRKNYSPHEAQALLHNMIYLDPAYCPATIERQALDDKYNVKCNPIRVEYIEKRIALDDEYRAKRKPIDAEHNTRRTAIEDEHLAKRLPLLADYKAKRVPIDAEILAYIILYIPDCPWPYVPWNKG